MTYGVLRPVEGSGVPDLVGRKVVKAEHLTSDTSDADERVVLTFDDASVLTIETSEWLGVSLTNDDAHNNGRVQL